MTGLWQVNGKNKTTFQEMIRLDIAYARNRSLRTDIGVLLKTIPAILEELFASVAYKKGTANVVGGK